MRKRTTVAVLTAVSALVASVLAAPPSAQANARTPKSIPHTKPAWIAHAQNLGPAADSHKIAARVYLAPRGGTAALANKAMAVSTPGNAEYRRFLTAAQFYAQFAPTRTTVDKVSAWLRSSGVHVTRVAPHNRYLAVTGTVAALENAFSTHINAFRKDGRRVQAPTTTLKAPAGLAASVLTVTGVDTAPSKVAPNHIVSDTAPPSDGFRNARPCSLYYGQVTAKFQNDFSTPLPRFGGKYLPYAVCGYTGSQYRSAYGGATGLTGKGITVAITDAYASPTIASDAKEYANNHGDAAYAPGQLTQVKPASFNREDECNASGWYGEETLDVEAVHGVAPAARIRYYASASCFDDDFLDTLSKVVSQNKAQLVSNSWGDLEANETTDNIAAYEEVFQQGAVQGISFMYSSGDNGDDVASSGTKQTEYPTSDPWVTAVGGTSDAIGNDGKFAFQTGWGTVKYNLAASGKSWTLQGFLYGAGGGHSSLFPQPAYQHGVAPAGSRQVPDVAMDADPNAGMLVGQTQTFPDGVYYDEYRIGGTSLASPLFAGMTALALQKAGTGTGAGLLNPAIYANASTGVFRDVKGTPPDKGNVRVDYVNGVDGSDGYSYSIRLFNMDSSLKIGPGWDNVTGVGSPKAKYFKIFTSTS